MPCFFVTFNIIISDIFPEDIIEIPQFVHKIWRRSSSILTIFINFLDFFTFPFCKETHVSVDVSVVPFKIKLPSKIPAILGLID